MTEPAGARTVTVGGVTIPKLAYGTWQVTGRAAEEGVADALALGYRHVDTARMYGNEDEVGRGLRASGVDRDEVWLTTKVWAEDAAHDAVIAAAEDSVRRLGVERVDLLLLHWPNPAVPVAETMGAMVELQERGLIRHPGVSNFPTRLVAEALEHAPVVCNQVELHPYLGQPAVLAQARERDLVVAAYSPFAHGLVHDDPVLREIGAAHGRSAGQVALRWLLDQPNVCALPKASSHDRRAENLDVFGFALSDEERGRIAGLERGERTANPSFAPEWDAPSRG
jgi:2,5-diketo-D-gluconate reductase B